MTQGISDKFWQAEARTEETKQFARLCTAERAILELSFWGLTIFEAEVNFRIHEISSKPIQLWKKEWKLLRDGLLKVTD